MLNNFRSLKKVIKEPFLDLIFGFLMMPAKKRRGRTPFGSEELRLIHQALLSQNLCCINGRMVPTLEREFALAYGVPYAVASTSGTAAIHTALGAIELNPGDEVITAPITDLGTIIPILYQNAIPVFADVDDTYNMDPYDIEQKITPRTRAIIVVHLFGNPCNMDAIMDIARYHSIPVIEDCSQAHMTTYKGKYVGTIGDIGCFSFQQAKHMTTGDGGMTITSNKEYYEKMRFFVDKGYARKGWGPRAYLFHAPNYRMTELVGAVGLAQLKKVKAVVKKRAELGKYMTELLSDIPGIRTAPVTPGASHSYWMYPLHVDGVDIDALAIDMKSEGIPVVVGYTGKPIYICSESLFSKKTYGKSMCPFTCGWTDKTYEYKEGLCPRAEELLEHLICIIWDESWGKEDVKRIAMVLKRFLGSSDKKRESLKENCSTEQVHQAVSLGDGKQKIRIGIVGCGQMGRWHFDSYKKNPDVELVSFADLSFEKAKAFAREVGGSAYISHKDMILNEKLDGVSVCTIPSTHREIVLDLLGAGINVLCEKPLATSVYQAKEMVNKAREKKLLLLPAFKFRFFEEVIRAKELLVNGGMGKVLNFRLMFGGYIDMSGKWYSKEELSGGGVIMDNGPHALDLIHYLFGEIESVLTEAVSYQRLSVEDTANLGIHLKNGAFGTVNLSWSIAVPSKTYLEIYCEDGAILLDPEGISYRFKTWNEWKRIPNKLTVKEAFGRQINHFISSIKDGKASILNDIDGLKSQIIIEVAYRSLREGARINLGEFWSHYETI